MSLEDRKKLAEEIHFNSLVLDCHNDTMMKCVDEKGDPLIDLGGETDLAIDLKKARKGGLDIGYFAAFTAGGETDELANHRILSLINALYWNEAANREKMEIVGSVGDIERVVAQGKLAALPTIEGAYSLNEENYIGLLKQYHDLGVRVVAYVWNQENKIGAGTEGPEDMGLTDLGIRLTREMNKMGILIDVSHMNEKTFWDCIEHSRSPIMASHSCAAGLVPHVRNLTDEQILALKERGGLVNINYWWELLGRPRKKVDVTSLVDHIDYVVDLVGVDHVGLGSDFDGASLPEDLKTAEDLPKVSLELVKRGYKREEIEKILGLNNLRLLRRLEEASYRLDQDIDICLNFKMGDRIEDIGGLEGYIGEGLDLDSYKIIVDGLDYRADYRSGKIILDEEVDLYEGYHVISFELAMQGSLTRKTRIIRYG